jgi:signal peptidase I
LVDRFTHVPSHIVSPFTKHTFDVPIPPRVQVVPGDVVVAVEVVVVVTAAVVVAGTAVVVSAGRFVQVDALQIMPAGHWFPQMPQLLALDASS